MQPHRRQFVIGAQPFAPSAGWREIEISGLFVSHCEDLPASAVTDLDNSRHVLLGRAIESRSDHPDPIAAIEQARTRDVQDLYQGWAGRWALVGGNTLQMDASGLLGAYYFRRNGAIWASSSPALAAKLASPERAGAIDKRSLRYEEGLSWVIPPRSRIPGVKRLLASQVLNMGTGAVAPRLLTSPSAFPVSSSQVIDAFSEALTVTLKRLAEHVSPIWLGLSAGYDSRTVLAICRKAGVPIKTYTRVAPRMSVADIVLPPKLAAQCGVDHVFLKSGRAQSGRRVLTAEHSRKHLSDGDALPFLRGERDELSGVAVGGHAFEMFSGDYGPLAAITKIADTTDCADEIANAFGYARRSPAALALEDWIAWAVAHPEPGLDWRDRFFIEQDNGGWLSAKEQLYDLNEVERFPVLNAARNYALLLSLPDELSEKSRVQLEIIRRNAPDLLKEPFNPPDMSFSPQRILAAKSGHLPAYLLGRLARRLRHISDNALRRLSAL